MRGPSPPPLPTDRAFPPVVQSLASGLLWIAEVIEEHGKLSKTVGRRAVYVRTPSKMGGRRASSKLTSASLCGPGRCCQAVIALHGLFLLVDKFPVWPILFGIACHGVYLVSPPFSPARVEREERAELTLVPLPFPLSHLLSSIVLPPSPALILPSFMPPHNPTQTQQQNFSKTWPIISLTAPTFLASCGLVLADHFVWFWHFSNKAAEARLNGGGASWGKGRGGPYARPSHAQTMKADGAPTFMDVASFFGKSHRRLGEHVMYGR